MYAYEYPKTVFGEDQMIYVPDYKSGKGAYNGPDWYFFK